jgi:chromosome segregation ATPase
LLDRVQRTEEEIARQEQQIEEATKHTEDLETLVQERLQESRSTLDKRITELVLGYTKEFHELGARLQATQHQVERITETFTAQNDQMKAGLLDAQDRMKQWQQQQETHTTDQITLLSTQIASLESIQARQNDLQQQLSRKVLDQAQEIASLENQLRKADEAFASKITALEAEASTAKAADVEGKLRSDRQEQRLTELFHLLQEEITARQARGHKVVSEVVGESPRRSSELGEFRQPGGRA